ncbi:MAG: undecaprenyl/decaprenyl-phosphate alpha-N-acetylglucosaminyl 1-phosphate transferase [Candidatus Omnitrophica bacterium]|nr:undecaprenyl/decaprenyl-phosphate alpha-N-acetylglucosaminyl 1-phosphate transferase [Candidatus Omnitrophota bacterium]
MQTFNAFVIAFLITFLSVPFFRKMALALNIVDMPNHKKIHIIPTPLLGGLAIYLGVLGAFFFFAEGFRMLAPIFICATIILYMGTYDDIKGLSARLRLFIQILLALILMLNGIRISFLPQSIWGDIGEILVTVIWIVGVTNAYNYLDGLDGLATGSAILNFLCFFVILYNTNQYALGLAIAILIGSCLGFLPYNFLHKTRMFLGDAGSTFIGFCLACIAIQGDWAGDNIVRLFIPILILGVPIFDMIFTTVMRIKEQKIKNIIEWLKYGGKDHFHHYLVDLGLSQKGAVLFIYYITFSLGLSAIMVSNDTAVEGIMTILQSSIIFWVIGVLIVLGKKQQNKSDARCDCENR